jgi:hypothetical protein
MTTTRKEQEDTLRELGIATDEVDTHRRAAKPAFGDPEYTAQVYRKFNGNCKPPAATGPEARVEDE